MGEQGYTIRGKYKDYYVEWDWCCDEDPCSESECLRCNPSEWEAERKRNGYYYSVDTDTKLVVE